MTTFYNRLEETLKIRYKSRNEVERDLGYPRNALSNYKYGKNPSATRLIELCDYLKVSPYYLLGLENKSVNITEIFEKFSTEQRLEMYKISNQWVKTNVYNTISPTPKNKD